MAQHTAIVLQVMRYTRRDFTALRAYLFKIGIATIARLYYDEDELELLGGMLALHRKLREMRDDLVRRTIEGNPHLAGAFLEANQDNLWHRRMVDYLVDAADKDSIPLPGDRLSAWLLPVVTRVLRKEGVATLGELIGLLNTRGVGWYKPVPRLGVGKAHVIESWLAGHAASLGPLTLGEQKPTVAGDLVAVEPGGSLVPMDRMRLAEVYDGSRGLNRNAQFCLVDAKTDLDAVNAYLYKFRGQPKTLRSYKKEIERFLLWCITVRGLPLSSVLVGDCEAYKDFLAALPSTWVGPRSPRMSTRWRPFAAGDFSANSQEYAIRCLAAFFRWLVAVRYLWGNPWVAVSPVRTDKGRAPLQINKALPATLWDKLVANDGVLATLCETSDQVLRDRYRLRGGAAHTSTSARLRLLRATILLLGTAGLRREEAAHATRNLLQPYEDGSTLWVLTVLGKGRKWRTTYIPLDTLDALKAHWQDRQAAFDDTVTPLPLLAPLNHPGVPVRHTEPPKGYTPDTLYKMLVNGLHRIAADDSVNLDTVERKLLRTKGTHSFRHTFGTRTAATVPITVLQQLMGHNSPETTAIYTEQEEKTKAKAMAKFFSQQAPRTKKAL